MRVKEVEVRNALDRMGITEVYYREWAFSLLKELGMEIEYYPATDRERNRGLAKLRSLAEQFTKDISEIIERIG